MAKILVVDDSEAVRRQLRKDLETKGHNILEAVDGLDGLKVLEENEGVQIIISDVNMPNMDGLDMCKKIHQIKKYQNIKIFMLTTEASALMKLKGVDAGIRLWIVKPYVVEKLLNAIDKVLLN